MKDGVAFSFNLDLSLLCSLVLAPSSAHPHNVDKGA